MKKVEKPEQLVTITKSDVSSECGPSGFNMGASTSQVNYNVMFPSTPRSPPPLISVPLTPPPTTITSKCKSFLLEVYKRQYACLSGMQRESQDL